MSGPTIDVEGFREFERAAHDRVADGGYTEFFAPITAGAIDTLLDAAGVTAERRVLDVAAGPGFVAGRAAGRGAAVTGVDLSPRPGFAGGRRGLSEVEAAAPGLGLQVQVVEVRSAGEIDGAFAAATRNRAGAVFSIAGNITGLVDR